MATDETSNTAKSKLRVVCDCMLGKHVKLAFPRRSPKKFLIWERLLMQDRARATPLATLTSATRV
jgi:hypothetical protein